MLTIGFPCREYTTFERIIRISLTFNYNIVFHFAIHLDGPSWSDAGIPAND